MKKSLIVFLVMCISVFSLVGCTSEEETLNNSIAELKAEVSALEAERDALENEIVNTKVENGTEKYVVTFNISQSHFTLDLGQHLKDSMNDISIQIPVDKEYYDSVEVGDTIADDFRMGSLIFKGSFGNWNVTVEDKCIQ